MTLGQRIQELRKQAGLSQEGLGEALGVSRQAVSKWESDGGIPELDTLIAMSKMFGVTIGQLLGVEEPKEAEQESTGHLDEAQVEAILRRYVEESRQQEPPRPRAGLAPLLAVLSVLMVVVLIWGYHLSRMVNTLDRDLSNMESNIDSLHNLYNSISQEVHEQITAALTEQANRISTFDWEVMGADIEQQTVTVRLEATLKDYSAGSKMQFLVDWVKVDDAEGQTVSDFVEGPDFSAEITLPMNYRSEVSIRVEDAAGNIQEHLVDYLYSLHPDSFKLEAYDLMKPFVITISQFGSTSISVVGEQVYVDIFSSYPELFWPEEAVITAWVNGKEVLSEQMTITPSEDSSDMFCAAIEGEYYELTMKNGDQFQVMVQVTDNLGRTEEFWSGAAVNNGELDRMPMAAPAVRVD